MARQKKKTRDEILKAKREAEKRRRDKIKADPVKCAIHKGKEKARKLKRKEEKKTKTIADLTPTARRLQRRKWRLAQQKSRELKRIRLNCMRRIREDTPMSEDSNETLSDIIPLGLPEPGSPDSPDIRPVTPNIESIRPSPSTNDGSSFSPMSSLSIQSLSSWNATRQKMTGARIVRNNRLMKNMLIQKQKIIIASMKKRIHALTVRNSRFQSKDGNMQPITIKQVQYCRLKLKIQTFLDRDDNSTMCPGKKDTITRACKKKQKRYLSDTLQNLHTKFVKETQSNISYTTFTRLRPFWIVAQKVSARDTCLCVLHENFKLIVSKLKELGLIKENSPDEVCKAVVCDTKKFKCMMKECHKCINKTLNIVVESDNSLNITYKQWMTKTELRIIKEKERYIKRTVKASIECTKKALLEKLLEILPKFLIHKFNIWQQYNAVSQLKSQLKVGEALLHIDFSENYQCKYAAEAQSVHFGASRQQLSLHTCVLYHTDNFGEVKTISFCSVSECLRHDAAAVYAHLKKSLGQLFYDKQLNIHTLHIFSDGPATQYKNKSNVYLFTNHLVNNFNLKAASWNFSESGHGKGAADGVGAVIKRTADSLVAQGVDIPDFLTFITKIVCRTNINLYTVLETDIIKAENLIPKTLQSIPETVKLHQITWTQDQPNKIFLRKLSCTSCKLESVCPHFPVGKKIFEYPINCSYTVPVTGVDQNQTKENLENKTDELAQTIEHLENETDEPAQTIEHLENETDKLAQTIEHLTNETDEPAQTIEHLENETDKLTQTIEHLTNETDVISLKIGSWLIVRFEGKKCPVHYVGQVMAIDKSMIETNYVVKFLRKKDLEKGVFFWQEPEDISLTSIKDIVHTLPEPTPSRSG